MHITGALGTESIHAWAAEVGQDISWASAPGSGSGSGSGGVSRHQEGYEPGILQV